ncbi:hypothetical protein GGR57DRAFT_467044, partial [Xylariaceae sp. FL1272]
MTTSDLLVDASMASLSCASPGSASREPSETYSVDSVDGKPFGTGDDHELYLHGKPNSAVCADTVCISPGPHRLEATRRIWYIPGAISFH